MSSRLRVRRLSALFVLGLLVSLLSISTAPAQAVAAPAGLASDGGNPPVLSWKAVNGASSYQLQLDDDPSFGSPTSVTTVNTRYVPTTWNKSGTLSWRVRAQKGYRDVSAWSTSEVDVPPVDVPVPRTPDGSRAFAADEPVLLRWDASRGAEKYIVEVDGETDFFGAKSWTTRSTAFVVPEPLTDGDWYWRVTAVKSGNLYSAPSPYLGFDVLPLDRPTMVSPLDGDVVAGDVVVDWEPVRGAKYYDVQVALDADFQNIAFSATNVRGTRYSPPITVHNDQVWWRVRAVDLSNEPTEWVETDTGFTRAWPQVPQPVYPAGPEHAPIVKTEADKQFYEWTPVPHASHYELIVDTDKNFSTPQSCLAASTTYTPRSPSDCGWVAGETVYWAVRPLDLPYRKPYGLPGLFSPTQAVTWSGPPPAGTLGDLDEPVTGMKVALTGTGTVDPGRGCAYPPVDRTDPVVTTCPGMTATPVLSWDPKPGVDFYQIYYGNDPNFTTTPYGRKIPTTANSMFQLSARSVVDEVATLPDSDRGKPTHWFVRPCLGTPTRIIQCGPLPVSSADPKPGTQAFQKTSASAGTVDQLHSSDPAGTEITFSWPDYLDRNLAGTSHGEPGIQSGMQYRIQVDDESSFATPLETAVVDQATYTSPSKLYPDGELYWRVQAIDFEGNGLPWSATATLTKRSPEVPLTSPAPGAAIPGTTPFEWTPQAFAAGYQVEVYKNDDANFSPANRVLSATVRTAAYTPTDPVPAGNGGYTWRVRRLDANNNPGPWQTGARHFTSRGAVPELVSPATGTRQPAKSVLVRWNDVPGAASYKLSITGATTYHVTTVATGHALTRALPTGSYSWRVTALDNAGKALGTSGERSFRVDATGPQVVSKSPSGTAKRHQSVVVRFNEKVKNVTRTTVYLQRYGAKGKIGATVRLDSTKRRAVLNPRRNLRRGTYYKVTLKPGIKDLAGNPLRATSWLFRVS